MTDSFNWKIWKCLLSFELGLEKQQYTISFEPLVWLSKLELWPSGWTDVCGPVIGSIFLCVEEAIMV